MFLIIYKPVSWFALQINWLVSIWLGTLVVNVLKKINKINFSVVPCSFTDHAIINSITSPNITILTFKIHFYYEICTWIINNFVKAQETMWKVDLPLVANKSMLGIETCPQNYCFVTTNCLQEQLRVPLALAAV